MSDWVKGTTEETTEAAAEATTEETTKTTKNKYQLVGEYTAPVNPFGADPENHAAREPRVENESDPFMQIEKEVSSFPTQEVPKPVHRTPAEDPVAPRAPKGFRLNPILVVAALSLLVLGTCWMMGVFRKREKPIDGDYKFTYVDVKGEKVTPSQLSAYGVNTRNMTIKIDGDYADLTVFGFTGHCDFEQVGNEITITNGSKYMTGKADISKGIVTLQHNGSNLVFEKQ